MKVKLPLRRAWILAEKVVNSLYPACSRIEIAGSIRRQRRMVDVIEIVVIPKKVLGLGTQLSLLGDTPSLVSKLDLRLDKLIREKPNFRRGDKNGELHKNFLIEFDEDGSEIGVDLFLTTPDQWGYIFALRTGPDDFNRAWVTQQSKGGLLPDQYNFSGGWLRQADKPIRTPEEDDVFRLIGGTIPPEKRDSWRTIYHPATAVFMSRG